MSTAAPVVRPLPAARRGTWTFLHGGARRTCHVYLMADVDATRLKSARVDSGGKLSYVSLLVKAAADVVAAYPQARSMLQGGSMRPRIAVLDDVDVKVLFDKTVDGERCVVAGTVHAAQDLSVLDVQNSIDVYKDAPVDTSGPFAKVKQMQRLPLPIARLAYRAAMGNAARRADIQGTFSVTSVGHEPVRAIFPMISGTLGFGIGRIADATLVRDGQIHIAPQFTLSLAFDHRVIDGALASEVLARVKDRLETWELS
ncbi:2-oxo acid dehydrogenase subunit E2 [Streptomyces sp. NPDC001930]|uniref:2-oxo acid dehydrogenase subunit E2 n=1 Tax=Streptomyces sp. NPDC001930 TaxID=3364625 RepID=UPI0036CD45D6